MSQNTAKAMAYIMNESGGDSQQGGCLYKPTSGIQWTQALMDAWQASEKADQLIFVSGVVVISLLIELSIGDKNFLCPCVHMWRV